jgi:hypothetical protein
LVFGVDLVESVLVDEEVSVDGDGDYDGPVVEDLLFDVLGLGGNAVISDFVFGALFCFLDADFSAVLVLGIVIEAFRLDQSVDFCVVEGAGDESAFALGVDELIAENGGVGGEDGELEFVGSAPSVVDSADGRDGVGG